MTWFDRLKKKAKETYQRLDQRVGGVLPGGAPASFSPRQATQRVTRRARQSYQAVDRRVGGYLPGGTPRRPATPPPSPPTPSGPRSFAEALYGPSQPKPASRTLNVANEIENTKRRLEAVGIKPPTKQPSLWERFLDILDRPSAFGRAIASQRLAGRSWGQAVRSGVRAFRGQEKTVTGEQLLEQAARGGNPLARRLARSKAGRFAGGLFLEIALDPTSFLSIGRKAVTHTAETLAPRIAREVAQETGRRITQESAKRLAENALRGEIPVGRLGAAVQRAMGNVVEARSGMSGVPKIVRQAEKMRATRRATEATARAKSFAEALKQATPPPKGLPSYNKLRQQLEEELPKARQELEAKRAELARQVEELRAQAAQATKKREANKLTRQAARAEQQIARTDQRLERLEQRRQKFVSQWEQVRPYNELAERAKRTAEEAKNLRAAARAIKPEGVPTTFYDVLKGPRETRTVLQFAGVPVLELPPLRTKLGAVIRRTPFGARVIDTLGRMFVFNYIPTHIQGAERIRLQQVQDLLVRGTVRASAEARRALHATIRKWGRVPRQIVERAPYAIENPALRSDPRVRAVVEQAERMFAEDVERLHKAGIPLRTIDNYVMHLYDNDPKEVLNAIRLWRQRVANIPGSTPAFTQRRYIPTLEEAKRLDLKPIEDVRVLTAVHKALAVQAEVLQRIARDLLKMGGGLVSDHPLPGYIRVGQEAPPALQGKYLHPEVFQTMANLWPVLTNSDPGIKVVSTVINQALNVWKALATAYPGFHIRNFLGNVWLNLSAGLWNPARYAQAAAALLGKLDHVELAGRRVPAEVVRRWFEDLGLVGQGFSRSLMGEQRLTKDARRALEWLERNGFSRALYFARHPLQTSRQLGEWGDSLARMANFLHHLDLGLRPQEAADRVIRTLFDYSRLTAFEKQLRNWFPFYAWRRNAIPKMVEILLGTPGLFTGSIHAWNTAVNVRDLERGDLPDWIKEGQAIPVWVDGQGNVYFMTLNLPYTELSAIHDPREVQRWMRELMLMTNPFVTVPAQLAANQEFFTGSPITETPGLQDEALRDYALFILESFGGLAGRSLSGQVAEQMRERREQIEAARGVIDQPPDVPQVGRGLPIVAQHPTQWARRALYEQRSLLRQAVEAAEARGVVLPTIEELERPTSFAQALSKPPREITVGGEQTPRSFAEALSAPRLRVLRGEPPAVIEEAMRITGVDPSWAPYLVWIMQHESSGNPTAIGPADPNDGMRALGLFQLKPYNLEKYGLPGRPWHDPVNSAVAAIRYIQDQYGHPSRIPRIGRADYKGY